MGRCEEEGLFSRSNCFPGLLGVRPTERELLLNVTNFGLALIYNLPERQPVSLSMRVPSDLTNGILEVE